MSRTGWVWVVGMMGLVTGVAHAEGVEPPKDSGDLLRHLHSAGGVTAARVAEAAIATAPNLARADAAVMAAEAGARVARAGLLPHVTLSARVTRLSDVGQPSLAGDDAAALEALLSGVDDPEARALLQGITRLEFPFERNQLALNATVTYPVSDLFLTILPALRAAGSATDTETARLEAARADVALRARRAFYDYVRARATLVVAEAAVEQAEVQHRHVDSLVSAGVAPRVDVTRMEARRAAAREARIRAEGGVHVASRAIHILMHTEDHDSVPIGEDLSGAVPALEGDVARLTATALEKRPEVRALRHLIEARRDSARAYAGARWPQLAVQGNFDYANPNARVFPQTDQWRGSWEVGAALSWSPDQAVVAEARRAEASAHRSAAEADLVAMSDAIRLEVSQAFEAVRTAEAALETARAGLVAAEESYRVRFEELTAGTSVVSQLIDADRELTAARLALVDAATDLRLAHVTLRHATGAR